MEREEGEYICALCGETESGWDPRTCRISPANVTLTGESSAEVAAACAACGDEALVGLLEHETDGFAVRKIISRISDTKTLVAVARTNGNAETRKEAVLEAYERDRSILGRINDEKLLCVLGRHVTDADDLLHAIERIENQQCL